MLKSSDTPSSDKIMIVSALSYLILPVSLISAKRFSVLGWMDEIAAIMLAYNKVKKHITPEIESEVENTLEKLHTNLVTRVLRFLDMYIMAFKILRISVKGIADH